MGLNKKIRVFMLYVHYDIPCSVIVLLVEHVKKL